MVTTTAQRCRALSTQIKSQSYVSITPSSFKHSSCIVIHLNVKLYIDYIHTYLHFDALSDLCQFADNKEISIQSFQLYSVHSFLFIWFVQFCQAAGNLMCFFFLPDLLNYRDQHGNFNYNIIKSSSLHMMKGRVKMC